MQAIYPHHGGCVVPPPSNIVLLLKWIHYVDEIVWILISWLHWKPADLYLHCFYKKGYFFLIMLMMCLLGQILYN